MMESYLLKSSLSLIVLYGLYRVVLMYEPNHQLNRFLGLACLIFSTGLLFIPIADFFEPYIFSGNVYTLIRQSSDVQAKLSEVTMSDSTNIYFMIYLVGVGVFSVRSLIGLATLIYFYSSSKRYHRWGFKVVTMDKTISPFTFFNILFIGNQRLEDENRDVMLVHEQFHRDQYHSIDTLILEGLTILFWFNPFIWFFKRDIRAEHEFLADAQVLKKVVNRLEYQQLLFESRTGVSIQLGNYLSNKTSLTKRFKMMTNKKTNTKMSFMRVTASVVVMGMMMVISSFSEIHSAVQPDVPAVYKQGKPAMYHAVADNIIYPKSARDENRSGTVHVYFTVNENGDVQDVSTERKNGDLLEMIVVTGNTTSSEELKGADDAIKSEAVNAVKGLGKFTPAKKDGKAVSSVLILPIRFILK